MLNVLPEATSAVLQSNGAFATFTLLSASSSFISSSPFSGVVIQWSIAFSSPTRHDSTLNPHHKAYYVIKINQITALGSSKPPMALCPPSFHPVSTFTCTYCIFHHQSHKRVFLVFQWKQMPCSHAWDFNGQQRNDKGNCNLLYLTNCKITVDWDSDILQCYC